MQKLTFKQQIKLPINSQVRVALAGIVCIVIIRLMPYAFPIYAQDIAMQNQAVTFFDRSGLPLGTILSRDQEHTAVVSLNQVSPVFIDAILAAEDQNFYQHGPIDLKAIARAVYQTIETGKVQSGASTITMQLARMLGRNPRNLGAKLTEVWGAWRLAAGMNKTEILTAYVNRLPMGGNLYGVEAAAQTYFGISAQELNLSQASLLAAIPNNPSNFNPYRHYPALKKRQRYVLNRLIKIGKITKLQGDRAYAEKITLQPKSIGIKTAPHFLFWLAKQLPKDHPAQIKTTLERPLQEFIENQLKITLTTLKKQNVNQGAALVIDNLKGEVLAYVGSQDYFNSENLGSNDGVQALRQPGSTLKPFLYELGIEKRLIKPNTILADVPTHYAIPGAKIYSPRDYNEQFLGPVRVRLALANSLNVPAVRVLEKVGVPNFLDRLQALGFKHLNQTPEYYGLGLTLGSGEVNLWELAQAYRAIALQGKITPLVTVLPTNQTLPTTLGEASSWAFITNILSDRYARAKSFGVESILNLPFATAVKTGTSSNFRDTWTVGFSRDYTVAVWVGNFDGQPMRQVSGVTGAAPLWNRIFLKLHENNLPATFYPPKNMIEKPICALSGLKPTPACLMVVTEYFWTQDLSNYENHSDTFYQPVNSSPISINKREILSKNSRLNLPPEYDQWLARQTDLQTQINGVKILFPRPGSKLLLPSSANSTRLAFKITNSDRSSLEWWLNGQKKNVSSDSTWFWPMEIGQWQLEIKQTDQKGILKTLDSVQFEIQKTEPKSARGFSTAPNH